MALMRVVTPISEAFKILHSSKYQLYLIKYLRVDLVADCYIKNSIKAEEKRNRDFETKIIIKSPKCKIPRDFSNFLLNGENKTRMSELHFQTKKEIEIAFTQCSENLRKPQMIFLHEQEFLSLKLIGYSPYSQMLSNHKEANIKFIAYHDRSTAGKTSTLGKETFINRNFSNFQ